MADTGPHMSKTSDNKLKYTTFIGSSNVQNSKLEECLSLQDAFKRYRKARQVSLLGFNVKQQVLTLTDDSDNYTFTGSNIYKNVPDDPLNNIKHLRYVERQVQS